LNRKCKKVLTKKKRGRPKNVVAPLPEIPVIKTTKIKFKGYCPRCKFMITKHEMVSKKIFECPSCGKRATVSKLKKEIRNEFKPSTKKEYLESIINHNHHDMPDLNDSYIPSSELKIRDT